MAERVDLPDASYTSHGTQRSLRARWNTARADLISSARRANRMYMMYTTPYSDRRSFISFTFGGLESSVEKDELFELNPVSDNPGTPFPAVDAFGASPEGEVGEFGTLLAASRLSSAFCSNVNNWP